MRDQMLRRAILQLLYERALEAPQSLIVGIQAREIVPDFDRLVPLTADTGADDHRLKSHP